MITNASLLDDETIETLLESGLDALKMSFCGLNRKEYESVHKGLSHDQVKGNIDRLLQKRKESGRRRPVVIVRYIGSPFKFPIFALSGGLGRLFPLQFFITMPTEGDSTSQRRGKRRGVARLCGVP